MDAPVKAGDIIDGRYQLERVIGTGGMAVVVAAIDVEVSERVALKFLFKKAARHKEILQRFEREKAVISRLEGEHIARMVGAGVVKNTPYMVMEYLQGRDLVDVLRVQKTVPVELAVEYVLQACEAVAEAHGLDIVHRDLKPGNLFLTHRSDGSPCIKVLDFGIAKILGGGGGAEGSLTRTEVVMGSPHYMSPEQMVSSKEVSPATDIWALGVILHELVAGKLPFAERTTEKLCARVLNGEPTPLREDCPSCPEGLEKVVARCLLRMPEERFADVGELALALSEFAPPHARPLVARVVHRLRHPGELPPEIDEAPRLSQARDPEEAPDAPTVYLQRHSRIPWKSVMWAAFGVGLLAVGFAGGLLFRTTPTDVALPPEAPAASSMAAPSLSATEVRPDPTEEEDYLADLPIEIDLDDGVPKAEVTSRPAVREERPARKEPRSPSPESPTTKAATSAPTTTIAPAGPPSTTTPPATPTSGADASPPAAGTSTGEPSPSVPKPTSQPTGQPTGIPTVQPPAPSF
jgi:serine/threonine-protein kinase